MKIKINEKDWQAICCLVDLALDADYVSKWRGLDRDEKKQLDGAMSGDFREGPVMVYLTINPYFI